MYVNARAIIERNSPSGIEIVLQTRNKPHEGAPSLELPGGRVEEFESLLDAVKREVFEETGLMLSHIEGMDTRIVSQTKDTEVECVQPFAVYQTTKGPADSMGVYFRCQAEGNLLELGDDTLNPHWVSVGQVAEWIKQGTDKFSWIDCAGLILYINHIGAL